LIPTTDQVDHVTAEERWKLMGFCERDEEWWKFDGRPDDARCPKCGNKVSHQVGFQPISQRTFNPELHGKKKTKKKR
jgi:hypothetical protein